MILFVILLTIPIIISIIDWLYRLYKRYKFYWKFKKHKKNFEETEKSKPLPYRKKYLLTKNEWSFYKELKPIADEMNFSILSKIRLADLVEVTTKDETEYFNHFNKISSKHIDFALAKKENLQIILLIELDDNSHKKGNERDEFINRLTNDTGYKLLRTKGTGELKNKIIQIINSEKQEKTISPI